MNSALVSEKPYSLTVMSLSLTMTIDRRTAATYSASMAADAAARTIITGTHSDVPPENRATAASMEAGTAYATSHGRLRRRTVMALTGPTPPPWREPKYMTGRPAGGGRCRAKRLPHAAPPHSTPNGGRQLSTRGRLI